MKTNCINKSLEKRIFDYISLNLSPKRLHHSMCVAELAVKIAEFYGEDIFIAQTAGLLHDCAKNMDIETMKKYIQKNSLKIPHYKFVVDKLPQVLHSYISADIAEKVFKIKDKIILDAVRHHTIGRTAMTTYEKILFVSDALSADRNYKGCNEHRKLIFKGLDNIFKIVLQNKISYIISNFGVLHPDIVEIWNFYIGDIK